MYRLIFFAKNMQIGGLEKALLLLLNNLDLSRLDVTLVLEEKNGAFLGELDPRIKVKQYSLSKCRFTFLRRSINLLHRLFWAVFHYHRYDFSCSYCTYSVIGSRLAQYASKNSSLYIHSDYFQQLDKTSYHEFFDSLRANAFSSLVFVSNESRESFISEYPSLTSKCHVINNLVDAEAIRLAACEPVSEALPVSGTIFIFVGRLEQKSKRLDRLIKSFYEAHKVKPEITLYIIGDGDDMPLCKELVLELGLSDSVFLLGSQVNPYKYMALADCLVLSSDYEGFPMVYFEALALGKGIISTIPVSDEQINISDYAQIVPKDIHALANAMIEFGNKTPCNINYENLNRCRVEKFVRLCRIESPKEKKGYSSGSN